MFNEKSPSVGGITATDQLCHTLLSPASLASQAAVTKFQALQSLQWPPFSSSSLSLNSIINKCCFLPSSPSTQRPGVGSRRGDLGGSLTPSPRCLPLRVDAGRKRRTGKAGASPHVASPSELSGLSLGRCSHFSSMLSLSSASASSFENQQSSVGGNLTPPALQLAPHAAPLMPTPLAHAAAVLRKPLSSVHLTFPPQHENL